MRKYNLFRFIVALLLTFLLAILAVFVGSYLFHNTVFFSSAIKTINNHHVTLTALRVCFFLVFFFAWPRIVAIRAKKNNWPPENIPKAVRLRCPILLFFLFLEAVGQISHGM